jgi:hypothetical protein
VHVWHLRGSCPYDPAKPFPYRASASPRPGFGRRCCPTLKFSRPLASFFRRRPNEASNETLDRRPATLRGQESRTGRSPKSRRESDAPSLPCEPAPILRVPGARRRVSMCR